MTELEAATSPLTPPGGPSPQERQWAMFAHLSALAGALLASANWVFSAGCVIGPLIIYLLKKDTMPFVADQGKEALNFNITLAIIFVALLLLTLVTFFFAAVITIPVYVVCAIAWLVYTIIAAFKAKEGIAYRYPFTLRLVK